MKKIIVVGSLNTDMVIRAPYCPKGGETLTGSDFMVNCGGKGANQATAAAKLGGNVLMCGCVGDDMFGENLINHLAFAGVNTRHVRKVAGTPTGTAVIIVTNGENRIVLDKGANACLSAEDIDAVLSEAREGDIYLTQLENPIDVIGYGLKRAKEKGLVTILNPAPADRAISKYFTYVDFITPNESELELFGGKEALFANGIRAVITTLGGDGYEYADKEGVKQYPCISVKVVDTTAAGDTFCGGMCAELAIGKPLNEAMAFGSKAASITCTRRGAATAIPYRNEVENWK
ncbi:MAG: ribokinase [Clostridiales bacterium]|nr:ribokinase [Clostridiales bacterium]